jgi:HK97 family phage prohead protease
MPTGVIAALFLPSALASELAARAAVAMPDADLMPAADMHITLCYLGDSTALPDELRGRVAEALAAWSASAPPVEGLISGMGRFNAPEGEPTPVYASFDGPTLVAFRTALLEALAAAGAAHVSEHGFDPHITLGYLPAEAATPDLQIEAIPARFDTVTLAWGDSRSTWDLVGAKTAPAALATRTSPPAAHWAQRRAAQLTGGTMARELKALPHFTKAINGRSVTGIFSVFGNIDSYDDIIRPGAFAKTLRERGSKIIHLWQHDFWAPPIATIDNIRELSRDELPEQIRREYPDALGGMEVTRTYVGTPRADEVFTLLSAGVPLEMSFAFDPIKVEYGEKDGRQVRYITEVRLYETSDVNWGANSATMASSRSGFPLDMLALHIERYAAEAKAGARHSTSDTALINAIHRAAVDLGCTECAGMIGDDDDDMAKQLQLLLSDDILQVQLRAGEVWRTVKTAALAEFGLTLGQVSSPEATSDDDASRAASDEALTRQRRMRLNEAALRLRGVAVPQESE